MDTSTFGTSPMKSSDDWWNLRNAAQRELATQNPNSLLDWAFAHRFLQGRPMRLIPALRDLYQDDHPFIVVQKAAQVFVSEYLINTALWIADTGQGGRGNALYVMPTQTQMDDFSQARLDKAIAESPYLQSRLFPRPPGRPGPARQRLKKLGQGYIYFRGADSRRQLTSVDADVVLLDEFDLMGEGVLELAQKRLASSNLRWLRVVSTPRLPEAGINSLFLQSDQRYYSIKCPGCGHAQKLEWEENVDQKRGLRVCCRRRCRKPLDLWAPGRWEEAAPGNDHVRGYHINRLYSPLANIPQMVYESQATTPAALREFRNAVLGESFVPPGGQLSLDVLDCCRRDYGMPDGTAEGTFMGVDVGAKLHVVIRQALDEDWVRSQAVFVGEVDTFEELSQLVNRYAVGSAVVDALPEQRAAVEFARRERSLRPALAYYGRSDPGHRLASESGVRVCHLNRTETLEEMFHSFQTETAELPRDARSLGGRVRDGLGEYYREMMTLTRQLEQNSAGNWVARYVDNGKADHFAQAEAYCRVAAKIRHRPTKFIGGSIGTSRPSNYPPRTRTRR